MDFLSSVEPQLAVPVILVVVFAVLVYIFGFQQTQEPSLQHLAVLHSKTSKSAAAAAKQKQQSQNGSAGGKGGSKGKEKGLANGHVIASKGKQEKVVAANKENVKPAAAVQTPQGKKERKADKQEEVDGGEWIPAVSRKDKKLRPKKEEIEANAVKPKKDNGPKDSPKKVLKETAVKDIKVKVPTTPNPKDKKKTPTTPVPVTQTKEAEKEATPVVEPTPKEQPKSKEVEEEAKVETVVTKPTKATKVEEPKSNVAFDEMGDMWEEAKSRGAKKKRARKD